MPTFTPSHEGNSGLDVLAAAALSTTQTGKTPPPPKIHPDTATVTSPGPHNPAAYLPTKIVKKILDLDFVEMSEITTDELPSHTPGNPPIPAKLPIQDISVWLERYSTMAAILASRFPLKAPELFAYQASIIRAERNYDNAYWVAYDRRYRREALAQKDLNWSVPNSRLYNETFTGRARAIPRCSHCLQEDHTAAHCPRNPNHAWFGWWPPAQRPPPSLSWQRYPTPRNQLGRGTNTTEACRRFNAARCNRANCRYAHCCTDCGGPHPRINCPRRQREPARPRSPLPQHHQGPPGPQY